MVLTDNMKLNKNATACEILNTGWCPLNCSYCYIPKTEYNKEMHKEIIERIETGKWIDELEETYDNIDYLSIWGTEPLLTLDDIVEQFDEAIERFGGLEQFKFSTSLCLDPMPIADLKKKCDEHNVKLDWQISADGHYTDENRMEGATEKIKKNLTKLISSDVEFENIGWKGTITADNFRKMAEDKEEIEKYMQWYEDVENYVEEHTGKKIDSRSKIPTLMVPGKYTSEDGKYFADYIKNMEELGYETAYTNRLKKTLSYLDEVESKSRMFTCSGGDSDFGFDNKNIHICHRTFYLDREEYQESIRKQEKYENWDVSLLDKGILDMINDSYIVDADDDEEMIRYQYVLRNYHDHLGLSISQTEAMVMELADCGQADKIYLEDEELRNAFALFVHTAQSCPMENLLNTSVIHFQPVSIVRLWSNGAFQELLKTV